MHAQTCMHQHYSSSEHISFLNHVSKTFIDKTDLSDPLKRKDYWKYAFHTTAPYGLTWSEH